MAENDVTCNGYISFPQRCQCWKVCFCHCPQQPRKAFQNSMDPSVFELTYEMVLNAFLLVFSFSFLFLFYCCQSRDNLANCKSFCGPFYHQYQFVFHYYYFLLSFLNTNSESSGISRDILSGWHFCSGWHFSGSFLLIHLVPHNFCSPYCILFMVSLACMESCNFSVWSLIIYKQPTIQDASSTT